MWRTGKSLSKMQLKIIRVRNKDLSVNDVWRNSIYGAEHNCNVWPQWIVSMKKQGEEGGLQLLFRVNIPFMLSPASFVILVLNNNEALMILWSSWKKLFYIHRGFYVRVKDMWKRLSFVQQIEDKRRRSSKESPLKWTFTNSWGSVKIAQTWFYWSCNNMDPLEEELNFHT